MHQAIALLGNTVALWRTVQIPYTLLGAQVRSASICEEQWEETSGMKKRVHPASMLISVCLLKATPWWFLGQPCAPGP